MKWQVVQWETANFGAVQYLSTVIYLLIYYITTGLVVQVSEVRTKHLNYRTFVKSN